MARLAIGIGYVVKDDIIPLLGADVAVGALAGPVTLRWDMARQATVKAAVIKLDATPFASAVAVGTLAIIVICRWDMARLTIYKIIVIRRRTIASAPMVSIVTVGTLAVVMVCRWDVA